MAKNIRVIKYINNKDTIGKETVTTQIVKKVSLMDHMTGEQINDILRKKIKEQNANS
jgi:hypothetical protein